MSHLLAEYTINANGNIAFLIINSRLLNLRGECA
jgi:hypothetical protein